MDSNSAFTTDDPTVAEAAELFHRFFSELIAEDYEAAVDCFAEDGFYSHPPFVWQSPGAPRAETHGRVELLDLLSQRMGRKISLTLLRGAVARPDGRVFLEGFVRDESGTTVQSFVSLLRVSGGKLVEYVAYDSGPPVGLAEYR